MSGVERRKEEEGAEGGRREINEEEKDDIVNLFTYTGEERGEGGSPIRRRRFDVGGGRSNRAELERTARRKRRGGRSNIPKKATEVLAFSLSPTFL